MITLSLKLVFILFFILNFILTNLLNWACRESNADTIILPAIGYIILFAVNIILIVNLI